MPQGVRAADSVGPRGVNLCAVAALFTGRSERAAPGSDQSQPFASWLEEGGGYGVSGLDRKSDAPLSSCLLESQSLATSEAQKALRPRMLLRTREDNSQ